MLFKPLQTSLILPSFLPRYLTVSCRCFNSYLLYYDSTILKIPLRDILGLKHTLPFYHLVETLQNLHLDGPVLLLNFSLEERAVIKSGVCIMLSFLLWFWLSAVLRHECPTQPSEFLLTPRCLCWAYNYCSEGKAGRRSCDSWCHSSSDVENCQRSVVAP